MELVDKEKVVAEIKKLYKEDYKFLPSDIVESVADFKDDLLRVLDSLCAVKEVDLEKEFDDYIEKQNAFTDNDNSEIKYYNGDSFNHVCDIYPIAKHFFELGLKTKKGE